MNPLVVRQELSPLESFGFEVFRAASYAHFSADAIHTDRLRKFQSFWDRLELDPYMADGGRYRKRRFGRFMYYAKENRLAALPDKAFFQSVQHNPTNGGVARRFAPLEIGFSAHPMLKDLIHFHARRIENIRHRTHWLVFVHQIRILVTQKENGQPTPEGLHQDGHDFVAQVLVRREGVQGAVSKIFDNPKRCIYQQMLRQPLDSILIDDRKMWHQVSPLLPQHPDAFGYRDMLLIDFNSPEKL